MLTNEREITDFDEINRVLSSSRVCRIALINGEWPYIVPMCFGYNLEGGKLELFFRCEEKGKKMDLIKNNSYAAFEIDKLYDMVKSDKFYGFSAPSYHSITGTGVIEVTTGIEKITSLDFIMKKYGEFPDKGKLPEQLLNAFAVLKLTAGEFCCKEHNIDHSEDK